MGEPDPAGKGSAVPMEVPRREPEPCRWMALAAVLLGADQASKSFFDSTLRIHERWNVLPFFDFTLSYNKGAAFSFLAKRGGWQTSVFVAVAVLTSLTISYLLAFKVSRRLMAAGLSLVLSGAIGNCIDRVAYGHVVDFLLFYWRGWHYPAFNVADACITCGVVAVVVDDFLLKERCKSD